MTEKMQKFAILCGSGAYQDYLTEASIVKARSIEKAFEEAENTCNNLENQFVFPLSQANIEKLKNVILEGELK